MKKRLQKLFILSILTLIGVQSFSQNQVYWKEGFEPNPSDTTLPKCNLFPVAPTVTGGAYFNGNGGSWYGYNVYRTTGSTGSCPSGASNNHVRYKNIAGVTDSGYIITPIVYYGINEFHILRGRASRSYTIWLTNDTLATTTNWTPFALMKSSAATVSCVDTMVLINSVNAKRLKIVGRPGTDTDVDSIWLTSVGVITPVKFGSISASEANSVVKLSWNIETETNTNSYIIERSSNGDIYKKIGILNAAHSTNYNWMDKGANNGINFYRIIALDNNGTMQYSSVVRMNVGKTKTGLNVYPNPVKSGQLNVELTGIYKGNYKANIYAMNGALIHTTTIVSEGSSIAKTIVLPTAMTAGNYTLEITNGSIKTLKTIIIN
jgi:hypothetical protein